MRATILALMLICSGAPVFAGAWPRDQGKIFLSFKYTGRFDMNNLALLDFTREDLFQGYGEFGISPRLTFGGQYSRTGPDIAPITEMRGFVRYTFLQRGAHVMSAELGVGRRQNDFEYEVTFVRPGIAWGRGFETRFGNGWMEIDAQAEIYDTSDAAYKLDATLGLNLSERFAVMFQTRAGYFPENDPYVRLAPSAIMRITNFLRVQAEIEAGAYNDTGLSGAIALWIDF